MDQEKCGKEFRHEKDEEDIILDVEDREELYLSELERNDVL